MKEHGLYRMRYHDVYCFWMILHWCLGRQAGVGLMLHLMINRWRPTSKSRECSVYAVNISNTNQGEVMKDVVTLGKEFSISECFR